MDNEKFYTLTGYKIKNKKEITTAMEDYIEMIYRYTRKKEEISVKDLSLLLNVRTSSVSKMINKLKNIDIVNFKKYGQISLTTKGVKLGKFYLERHNILFEFFKKINGTNFKLEQVEKIEHFVDEITIKNIKKNNN